MGDVLFGHKPGVKRADKMGDRTLAWIKELLARVKGKEDGGSMPAIFAPLLPIEAEQQSYYLDALEDELKDYVSGIAVYDIASNDAVPESFRHLPRLYLGDVDSPHKLLDAITLGGDIFAIPFISEATNAGIALDFSFPTTHGKHTDSLSPLGIDMWSPTFATSLEPLSTGCGCYTCTHHHRAFIQHLLNAKEMLAWVLLQLHNHHTIDAFFASIRQSLSDGTFESDRQIFSKSYATDLPAKTGQGPR